MKKYVSAVLMLWMCLTLFSCRSTSLPLPEKEEGMRGQLGIDKNINEASIDRYLNRSDSVYRDLRLLVDEADYGKIGGDSYLSGYVKGFEIVPYPYLCNVEGLPEEVGKTYEGQTLFTRKEDGSVVANYKESMHILESLFPRDKYIFLMCGGGGYSGMAKELLVALGWDGDRIYNTGGYWYYQGNNRVETFYEQDGEVFYDFSNVPYHPIEFSSLTPLNHPKKNDENPVSLPDETFIRISSVDELRKMEEEKKTFFLYIYLPGCSTCASFEPIVKEFKKESGMDIYAADLSMFFKESNSVSDRVSYSPSFFIYIDGEVAAYLDPQSDRDVAHYQSLENLSKWVSGYLDTDIYSSETVNEVEDCQSACSLTGE